MSNLNATPSGERVHIGFFGRRNSGKSSLVNAVTGQNLCIVSEIKGTTTAPVRKAMELFPLGPVLIIDTPGFDDEGDLGELRVRKAREILNQSDNAVLVVDASIGPTPADKDLLRIFREMNMTHIIAYNKSDLVHETSQAGYNSIAVSAKTGKKIHELKEMIAQLPLHKTDRPLLADLISLGDTVIMVTPIDSAAPKGRMILPQQQTIRAVLDAGAISVVVKESELTSALANLKCPPALVVTDSQVFHRVSEKIPADIPLTSFSILFARYKGFLASSIKGVEVLKNLPAGSRILIAEGCTHHRQCDDIGTAKLPRWLQNILGRDFDFRFCSGNEFPENLSDYSLVLHCGGCMLNERTLQSRNHTAAAQGIPFTNYGITIAWLQGILDRCLLHGRL